MRPANPEVVVDNLTVSVYEVPTDAPEADGTSEWDSTTIVIAEIRAGSATGLGYTYADRGTAVVIQEHLADVVIGADAMSVGAVWKQMVRAIRNLGRPGIASMAIAAVDAALWDLKARLLELPLVTLLGAVRNAVPVYGSGGFTSYSDVQLKEQLGGWAEQGLGAVKIKIGRDAAEDRQRVAQARSVIGDHIELFVDANGAHSPRKAVAEAGFLTEHGVTWLEEPVSSDDLPGLRFVRDHMRGPIDIAAGEYGYDLPYFLRMLTSGAVDVLQADASRCGGITGFLQVATLCAAFGVDLSAHCAPALHIHPCCASSRLRHAEYFHDHVRIESMFFEGTTVPRNGCVEPDLSRLGHGLELRRADVTRFEIP